MRSRSLATLVGTMLLGAVLAAGMVLARAGGQGAPEAPPEAESPSPSIAGPRMAVDHSVHDFGVVDADRDCEHKFPVRNVGGHLLTLRGREPSCKCIVSQLPSRALKPNEATEIRVVAHVRDRSGPFSDRVEIETNDPAQQSLTLEVRGTIRTFLGCDPPRVAWTELKSTEPATAEVVVYSQTWEAFDLGKIEPSLDCVEFVVAPAPAERLAQLDARSGYLVKITLPAGAVAATDSRFYATAHLRAVPAEKPEAARSIPLALSGAVRQRVALFGRKIDGQGRLQMGAAPEGTATRQRVVVHMRETRSPVAVRSIETSPEFLHARVVTPDTEAARAGVLHVDVEIPAGAPPGNHMGLEKGFVSLSTDHPDIPTIRFDVEFTIVARDTGSAP